MATPLRRKGSHLEKRQEHGSRAKHWPHGHSLCACQRVPDGGPGLGEGLLWGSFYFIFACR